MPMRGDGADHHTFAEILTRLEKDERLTTDGELDSAKINNIVPKELEEELFKHREGPKAVLGIDIYHYSRFPSEKQRLVPIIFDSLYDIAVKFCLNDEPAFFPAKSLNHFIPTGDGGFQILDSPLQCLIFAVMFQAAITSYNDGTYRPVLGRWVGELTLRYALTYDRAFQLDAEWYGAAIIRNARVLSRDSLNRFLADENSVEWFRKRISTVDSLLLLDPMNFKSVDGVPGLQKTLLFAKGKNAFRSLNVQRVGSAKVKESEIDIYNIYAQVEITAGKPNSIAALGNLNAGGITVD
jgi:hypothetical protein